MSSDLYGAEVYCILTIDKTEEGDGKKLVRHHEI